MAMEEFWIFVSENSKNMLKWIELSAILNIVYVMSVHCTIYNIKHSLPKQL